MQYLCSNSNLASESIHVFLRIALTSGRISKWIHSQYRIPAQSTTQSVHLCSRLKISIKEVSPPNLLHLHNLIHLVFADSSVRTGQKRRARACETGFWTYKLEWIRIVSSLHCIRFITPAKAFTFLLLIFVTSAATAWAGANIRLVICHLNKVVNSMIWGRKWVQWYMKNFLSQLFILLTVHSITGSSPPALLLQPSSYRPWSLQFIVLIIDNPAECHQCLAIVYRLRSQETFIL